MTTIAGHQFELTRTDIEQAADALDPEPIEVHFAVIDGRRFPPKQLIGAVTGLDRADFNSHQARAILQRLGFTVDRRRPPRHDRPAGEGAHSGVESRLLDHYAGRWVAQDGLEILYAAGSPQDVARWLHQHGRSARVWRVPSTPGEIGSAMSAPA